MTRAITTPSRPVGSDDRVTCATCRQLVGGKCEAWEALQAVRGYAPLPTLPRRCEGYAPLRGEADRRGGKARFPGLAVMARHQAKARAAALTGDDR